MLAGLHDAPLAGGLREGFLHPLTGWDHALAMVAVGIFGAQLGRPAAWMLPVAFPLLMAVGGALGFAGVPMPFAEVGIAASAVVLGGLVAFEARPGLAASIGAAGAFAILHGHAHGAEIAPGTSRIAFTVGFVAATASLHALGIALGLARRARGGALTLRAAGAAIAGVGMVFLARALAA